MPQKLMLTIDFNKINKPSIEELKQFGAQFSREEWEQLCSHKEFINGLLDRPISETVLIADFKPYSL